MTRPRHGIEIDVADTWREMLAQIGGAKDSESRLIAGSLTVAVFLRETSLMLESFLDDRHAGERRRKRVNEKIRKQRLKLVP